jgi:thymidylate synthase ThyX
MEEFTNEEKEILKPFFTNLDKPVFALINLPEVVKGALFSRYSRSTKSLRRTLLDEFIKAPEMGFKEIVGFQTGQGGDQIVAIKRAEEFYDRILVGFGDDSVSELGGAHLAVENISNIATKVIEDSRIGISPLEKSSRYVYFNEKVDGQYRYYKDPDVMDSKFSDLYVQACDFLFDTYAKLIDPMTKFVIERFPQEEGVSERAYAAAVRAKVCDIIRVLLPVGTLTNVGLFGNGRAFEYLLTKMLAHPLKEMPVLAMSMHQELSKVIPSFVKRAVSQYGIDTKQYLTETRMEMEKLAQEILAKENIPEKPHLTLVKWDSEAEIKVVAAMLYPYSHLPMGKLIELVKQMTEEQRKNVIREYLSRRTNRRHKAGRALENTHYTFDICANYGIYRDLHRHRILTQERQDVTVRNGYDTPKELVEAGFQKEYDEAMTACKDAFEQMFPAFPKQAQYLVAMGFRLGWYFTLSLREVYFLTELRTGPQGHADYRKIAQQMFTDVKGIHPNLVEFIKFVDMKDYPLGRIEAEKKIDKKMEELKKKYGS